jgi:hypothetical protein
LGIAAQSETMTLDIESTLEQEIRKGQLNDKKKAKFRSSERMNKELSGLRTRFVFQKLSFFEKLY